jgi:hypothetical protein
MGCQIQQSINTAVGRVPLHSLCRVSAPGREQQRANFPTKCVLSDFEQQRQKCCLYHDIHLRASWVAEYKVDRKCSQLAREVLCTPLAHPPLQSWRGRDKCRDEGNSIGRNMICQHHALVSNAPARRASGTPQQAAPVSYRWAPIRTRRRQQEKC